MASFVEQAVLRVIDKSSTPLRKINNEMRKVYASGRKLSKMRIEIAGLGSSERQTRQLNSSLDKLKRSSRIKVSVSLAGAAKATGDVNKLKNAIASVQRSKTTNLKVSGLSNYINQVNKAKQTLASIPSKKNTTISAISSGASSGSNIPGNTVAPSVGPARRGRAVDLNLGPLDNLLRDSWRRLGYTIEQSIVEGFKRGGTAQDVAGTRIALQGLPDQRAAEVNALSQRLSEQFPVFTKGEIELSLSELIPVVRGDEHQLGNVAESVLAIAKHYVTLGQNAEEAIDKAFLLAKAGESSGAFTSAATGKISTESIENFFSIMLKAITEFGREIDPLLVKTTYRNARTSKFSLNEKGILGLLALAEETGPTAGVGFNQLIKQLSGERIKIKQLNELIELGLIKSKEVKLGQGQTRVVGNGSIDPKMLRSTPFEYVQQYIIPAMRSRDLDPTDAVEVAEFAGSITSDRTATDALAGMILRNSEILDSVSLAMEKDVSKENLTRIAEDSLFLALEESKSQFANVLGEVARSMEDVLIPVLNSVTNSFQGLANYISGNGEGYDPLRTAGTVGGAALAAGGLFSASRGALRGLGLTGSATALTSSASQLSIAAAALQRAAGTQSSLGRGGAAAAGAGAGSLANSGGRESRSRLGPRRGGLAAGVISSMFLGSNDDEQMEAIRANNQRKISNFNSSVEGFLDENFGKSITDAILTRDKDLVSKIESQKAFEEARASDRSQAPEQREFRKRLADEDMVMAMAVPSNARDELYAPGQDLNGTIPDPNSNAISQVVDSGKIEEILAVPSSLESVVNDSATNLEKILYDGSMEFGDSAAAAMLDVAGSVGSAIGEKAKQILESVNLSSSESTVAEAPALLDTGPTGPR